MFLGCMGFRSSCCTSVCDENVGEEGQLDDGGGLLVCVFGIFMLIEGWFWLGLELMFCLSIETCVLFVSLGIIFSSIIVVLGLIVLVVFNSFLQKLDVWPVCLHIKQVIVSSVKKILKSVLSYLISREPGTFAMSSGCIYT